MKSYNGLSQVFVKDSERQSITDSKDIKLEIAQICLEYNPISPSWN